ncbi:MAG: adenosylcobinamide-phosphate synthase CbiB [Actinomycetota bacterium]|jgi:adenosylcobinamide-phosphate synthase
MTATPPPKRRTAPSRKVPSATGRVQGPYRASGATGRGWATAFGAAIGLLVDRALGEPPSAVHPVGAFGRAMAALERPMWRDSRLAGFGYAAVGAGLGSAAGFVLQRATAGRGSATGFVPQRAGAGLGSAAGFVPQRAAAGVGSATGFVFHRRRTTGPLAKEEADLTGTRESGPRAGGLVRTSLPAQSLATWLMVAGRALGDEARAIGDRLVDDDLDGARRRLPALVGRDPESLDAKGVARAVVESVAENTVDAVVAPACWAALGGAAGAGFYRAVNTLDAMVGHRNERYGRFGWASARLDDAANWIPARLTGLLVAAVRPGRAREVLDAVVHPPAHPSPNAGVAEAAFAAALALRLGGDTIYAGRVDPRPTFGTGRSPEPADIDAAIRLSRDVTFALAALLATPAVVGAATRRRRRATYPSPPASRR